MAAVVHHGLSNGVNGHAAQSSAARFSDIPPVIDIPVSEGDADEVVELDLTDLPDDPAELCQVLENENVAKNFWIKIALAYAKQNKVDMAIEIVNQGLAIQDHENRLDLLTTLCWMYLWKCREAPRVKQGGSSRRRLLSKVAKRIQRDSSHQRPGSRTTTSNKPPRRSTMQRASAEPTRRSTWRAECCTSSRRRSNSRRRRRRARPSTLR